jgi:hypothetical protein
MAHHTHTIKLPRFRLTTKKKNKKGAMNAPFFAITGLQRACYQPCTQWFKTEIMIISATCMSTHNSQKFIVPYAQS